jgi:hypothetical protein
MHELALSSGDFLGGIGTGLVRVVLRETGLSVRWLSSGVVCEGVCRKLGN